jgi:predicted  nucleic acid-binding Zn-ribbon protein
MATDQTEKRHDTLRDLQELDKRIEAAEDKVRSYDPLLAEVDEPALQLEQDVATTRSRLQEIRLDERRLELAADEKRARVKKLVERMSAVRNVREEAAVSAERDMLKSALDGEEQEALSLIEQIRKMETKLAEQDEALARARAELEPRRQELLEAREQAKRDLALLREQRQTHASAMGPKELRTYEGIRGSGRRKAVAALTPDGACGNCYSVVPLQLRSEVKAGGIVRCEGCGVIFTTAREEGA